MKKRMFMIGLVVAAVAGCAGSGRTQRTPTLVAPAAQGPVAPAVPKRDLLKEAGDTTWQVVTAPARMVAPPKKVEQAPPVVYEAPSAVFTRRSYEVDEVTTQPATRP